MSLLRFLGLERESEVYIENETIHFKNPTMYSGKLELITEIPFSKIKEICVITEEMDIASLNHMIVIELFDDLVLKYFTMHKRREIRLTKELFEALNIDFDIKHFSSRNELNTTVYKKEK